MSCCCSVIIDSKLKYFHVAQLLSCEVHVHNVRQRHIARLQEHCGGSGGGGKRAVASTSPLSRQEVRADGRGVKKKVGVATVVGGGVQVSLVVRPKQVEAARNAYQNLGSAGAWQQRKQVASVTPAQRTRH